MAAHQRSSPRTNHCTCPRCNSLRAQQRLYRDFTGIIQGTDSGPAQCASSLQGRSPLSSAFQCCLVQSDQAARANLPGLSSWAWTRSPRRFIRFHFSSLHNNLNLLRSPMTPRLLLHSILLFFFFLFFHLPSFISPSLLSHPLSSLPLSSPDCTFVLSSSYLDIYRFTFFPLSISSFLLIYGSRFQHFTYLTPGSLVDCE